jgi:hypothetical protein
MSVMSKIADAVRPGDEDEIAVSKALADIEDAKALNFKIYERQEKRHVLIAAKRRDLDKIALQSEISGDAAKFNAARAEIAKLEDEVVQADAAQRAALAQEGEATERLRLLGVAGHVKMVRRVCKQRSTAAASLVAAYEEVDKHRTKVLEHNEKLRVAFPLPPAPIGNLLFAPEFMAALQQEISRIRPVPALSGKIGLPGSYFNPNVDIHKVKSLVDQFADADAYLVNLVTTGKR